MSAPDDPRPERLLAPSVAEIKRTVGPIVKALADIVSPERDGLPGRGYKERLGIDFEAVDPRDGGMGGARREDILQRLLGVHAAACLAREVFGCPGLETYGFGLDRDGALSFGFNDALDGMGSLDGVGGMEWDGDGRFAAFLAERGADTGWMIAAAAIVLAGDRLRKEGITPDRNGVLEEAHFCCWSFTREYLSRVHGELAPLLAPGRASPREVRQVPVAPPRAASP